MPHAAVVKLVYTPALEACSRKGLRVRVSPAAHMNNLEAKIFAAELGAKMPELDLHGYYLNEALEKLELFLYKNYQNKETMVRIIYGFGTGKLRLEVLKYLGNHPLVQAVAEQAGSCVVVF